MLSKNIYLTITICLILVNPVLAQFDFRLTSAFGSMSLKPETNLNIHAKPGNFYTAGFQTDYYISENFGVGIGADYYLQNSKFDVILTDYSHSYSGMDRWETDPVPREYKFSIKTNTTDIIEQNTISYLDFPISAIFTLPLFNNVYLATRLGVKLSIPLQSSYVLNESDLYTRLYFEEWDLELFNIPAHGLYDSRTDWHPEGELDLNTAFSVFYEVGVDFPVSLFKVRLSGYFSYGLNNIINQNQSSLIYWREDYNYILSLAESVKMMQTGVKLGIGITSNYEKRTKYRRYVKTCPAYE